jgi:hypothetical protein
MHFSIFHFKRRSEDKHTFIFSFSCSLQVVYSMGFQRHCGVTKQGKAEQLHLLNCVQRSRNAGFSCSHHSPRLHPVCCNKRPLKEAEGFYFELFGVGRSLKGKMLKVLIESLQRTLT